MSGPLPPARRGRPGGPCVKEGRGLAAREQSRLPERRAANPGDSRSGIRRRRPPQAAGERQAPKWPKACCSRTLARCGANNKRHASARAQAGAPPGARGQGPGPRRLAQNNRTLDRSRSRLPARRSARRGHRGVDRVKATAFAAPAASPEARSGRRPAPVPAAGGCPSPAPRTPNRWRRPGPIAERGPARGSRRERDVAEFLARRDEAFGARRGAGADRALRRGGGGVETR